MSAISARRKQGSYSTGMPHTTEATLQSAGMLSLIPHLEQNLGTFYPISGMISITNALHKLAERKEPVLFQQPGGKDHSSWG